MGDESCQRILALCEFYAKNKGERRFSLLQGGECIGRYD